MAIYDNFGGLKQFELEGIGEMRVQGGQWKVSVYDKDLFGNIRNTVAQNGTIERTYDADVWGYEYEAKQGIPSKTYDEKFLGNPRDRETGFDFTGARLYESRLGLFLGAEPLYHKFSNFNPFGYALSNPARYVDKNGDSAKVIVLLPRDRSQTGTFFLFENDQLTHVGDVLGKGKHNDIKRKGGNTPTGEADIEPDESYNNNFKALEDIGAMPINSVAYGPEKINIYPTGGDLLRVKKEGLRNTDNSIKWHGGGTRLGHKAFDPNQPLIPTAGCLRSSNSDIKVVNDVLRDDKLNDPNGSRTIQIKERDPIIVTP